MDKISINHLRGSYLSTTSPGRKVDISAPWKGVPLNEVKLLPIRSSSKRNQPWIKRFQLVARLSFISEAVKLSSGSCQPEGWKVPNSSAVRCIIFGCNPPAPKRGEVDEEKSARERFLRKSRLAPSMHSPTSLQQKPLQGCFVFCR